MLPLTFSSDLGSLNAVDGSSANAVIEGKDTAMEKLLLFP